MIVLALGTLYGVGIGLTLVGEMIYVIVLGSLRVQIPLLKTLGLAFFWPMTWAYVGYQIWKVSRDGA